METSQQENTIMEMRAIAQASLRPSVFNYQNYRRFLSDAYAHMKTKNPAYSESAFIRSAGYGASSRGYLTLIVSGKRNLSAKAILGFATAMKLSKVETEYFESLVLFNQAETAQDKEYYFSKINKMMKGKETKAYKILKGQFNLYSKWYLIAIRELVSLKDFINEPTWIAAKLRNKVTAREVTEAIEDLKNLGLLKQDGANLFQTSEFISLDDEVANNQVITNYHKAMMDKTKEYLDSDPYEVRSASSITFTCKEEDFAKIREEVAAFQENIINKFGLGDQMKDTALHMGIQLFHITEPKLLKRGK